LPADIHVKIDLDLSMDEWKKVEGRKASTKLSGTVIRYEKKGKAICFDVGRQ